MDWSGEVGFGMAVMAGRGLARRGKARLGKAVKARLGGAWPS